MEYKELTDDPPPTLPGFMGARYKSIESDSVKRWATLYHDKEEPTDQAFEVYYANDGAGQDVFGDDGIQGYADNTVTFKADSYEIAEAQRPLFKSTAGVQGFPVGANRWGASPSETFDGTFHGVEGKYACTDCTFYNDEAGNLAEVRGTLTFKPNVSTTMVEGVIPDREYLYFGYWLTATKGQEGNWTYEANATGYPRPLTTVENSISRVEGTATYKGSTVGMFVKREFGPHGDATSELAGEFTGDVRITADFSAGSGTVALNNQYSVYGEADNFRHNGQLIDENWTLTFQRAKLDIISSTQCYGGPCPGNFTHDRENPDTPGIVTQGESTESIGTYYSGFGGIRPLVRVVDPNDPANPKEVAQGAPLYNRGNYEATFRNGRMVGTWGATLDDDSGITVR